MTFGFSLYTISLLIALVICLKEDIKRVLRDNLSENDEICCYQH